MNMAENMSLADIGALMGNNGFGNMGGEGIWIFALLILLFGGNGFGNYGNRVGEAYATQADIQRAVDLNSIQQGQADIAADIQRTNYEQIGATKDVAYNNLSEIRDVQASIASGFANSQKCCCDTLRAIDGVNYNGALNTASINANTTAQTQKILDAMAQNKIETLQSRINELELNNALCGVPRISNYAYGITPQFASCGCGCNSVI